MPVLCLFWEERLGTSEEVKHVPPEMTLHTTVPRHQHSVFPKFEGCGLNREEERELRSYTENAGSPPGKRAQIKEELKDGEKRGMFGEEKGTLGWPCSAGHMQTNKPKASILLLPAEVTPPVPQNLPRHTCPALSPWEAVSLCGSSPRAWSSICGSASTRTAGTFPSLGC